MYGTSITTRLTCWLIGSILIWPGTRALAAVEITVRTIEREQLTGQLIRFDMDAGLIIQHAQGEQTLIPSSDIVHIGKRTPAFSQETRDRLILNNGDTLYGSIVGTATEQVVFDTVMRKAMSVPLAHIRAIIRPTQPDVLQQQRVQELLTSTIDEDHLLLRNKDLLRGFVDEITATHIMFEHQEQIIKIELPLIHAVVLASDVFEPATAHARVEFSDGSALTVTRMIWTPSELHLTHFDGTSHDLSPQTINRIELRGQRWTWLSHQQAVHTEHVPMLSVRWPTRINFNVLGQPLMLDGQTYKQGLGVHSRSMLRYELGGTYRLFHTICGLDDSAGPRADVAASVVVDGRVLWHANINRQSRAHKLRLDITGANVLELIVDYGSNGDLQDRFNWADAALIR